MKDKLLTVKEAAEFLICSEYAVREKYIKKGQLKAHRIGNGSSKKQNRRSWRIWEKDLIKFVNKNSNLEE